ncbi:MAG: 50S ribosomal protein L29 [Lentisphaeria bacterium]
MKQMKNIRELTGEELARTVREHRQEAFNLRLQAQTGQLENSARMRTVRREIASLLTEQRARELKPQTDGK